MKHKHHKIPRYMGGSNHPSNLIEVSITQHIMWHFANWKLWGNYQDKIAYKLLANTDASAEMQILRLENSRKVVSAMTPQERKQKNKKTTEHKRLPETRAKLSNLMKKQRVNGIALTEEGRQRVLEGAKRANETRSRGVLHTETGIIYPSIREAAKLTHTSRNTIKNCIKQGLDKWVEV